MFCSKCGKTLPPDGDKCPACGLPIGESRFEGSPYTSAQAHILPGDDVHHTLTQSYTRTVYTSAGDAEPRGDADARTTYRPAYGGDSMPEEMHRDMRAAVNAPDEAPEPEPMDGLPDDLSREARDSLNAMDEELRMDSVDLTQFRAQPIESEGQSGISSDVSELIQELESESPRKTARRRTGPAYGEYDEDSSTAADGDTVEVSDDQPEVFNDIDEEEFEELRHSSFSIKQLLKVLIVLVAAAALIVGGLMWFRYIQSNQSSAPIENVREDLYNAGIELIRSHASEESITAMLTTYTSSASDGLIALNTALQESAAEVTALLPEDATENEQLFVDALESIQANIGNCILSDALAVGQQDTDAVDASDSRWAIVNNSIAMLEAADTATELTAILNGEQVEITEVEATPTPTPAPNYNTLSRGDVSDEVLEMQNRLYELGWLLGDRDGNFGTQTQTAVKMFQQAAGLEVTGIADNATLTALYADDAPTTLYADENGGTSATSTPAPEDAA